MLLLMMMMIMSSLNMSMMKIDESMYSIIIIFLR